MKFNFLTIYPERIHSYFNLGLHKKALEKNLFSYEVISLLNFGNKHGRIDDTIYGGGPGMLIGIEPISKALDSLGMNKGYVILTSPSGELFTQKMAIELSKLEQPITLIAGHYEGVDHRVVEHMIDREVSIGNYVLTSGDLPSLCISDSILRLLPGFVGDNESLIDESHSVENTLEYPQYTRPYEFNGWKVPDILLAGNHAKINEWREKNRKNLTGRKNHE